MDGRLQEWINGLAGHSEAADALLKVIASDLNNLVVPFLVVLWLWPAHSRALNQRLVVAVGLAIVLAKLLADGLDDLHYQARPFVSDASTRLLIAGPGDNGFPSGHTSFAFSVGGALVWWSRRLGVVALACAAAVGFGRIYVGVHWPSDVIAGACVGLLAGAVAAGSVPLLVAPQRWASHRLPAALLSPP